MDEILEKEYRFFVDKLIDKPKAFQKLFHFKSVLNIYNALNEISNSKSEKFKQDLLYYFYELIDLNYELISKVQSVSLFENYLAEIGKFLMKEKGFSTRTTLLLNVFIGAVLDLVFIYFIIIYDYPIFILISLFLSILQRKNCIRKKKYFAIYW
jgi:hypothetical protein